MTAPSGANKALRGAAREAAPLIGAPITAFSGLLAQQLSGLGPLGALGALGAAATGKAPAGTQPAAGARSLAQRAAKLVDGVSSLARTAAAPPATTSVAGTSKNAAAAVSWARGMVGRQDWNNLCQRFVEEAFGTRGVYPSAVDAARGAVTQRGKGSWRNAPVGALLYFAGDETNGFNGHAGIYLGNGRMVSARPTGVQEESLTTAYNQKLFVGWGEAKGLPGRPAA